MATSMMRVFADSYGLDAHDVAELFGCTDRTARNKLARTPDHDIPRIIQLQEKFDAAIALWRENVVNSVLAMSEEADERLIFMTQSFEKNADFKDAVERDLGVETSTGVPPIAALYNSALFQAFTELYQKGEVMMTMAYDPEDPRSVEFGMDVLSRPSEETNDADDEEAFPSMPPMSQDELNDWATEDPDERLTFKEMTVHVSDDGLNAPAVCKKIIAWLPAEVAEVLEVEDDDDLDPGYATDVTLKPRVNPERLSDVIYLNFASDRCKVTCYAWADGDGFERQIDLA